MEPTFWTPIASSASMPAASSRAPSPRTCRSCRRRSSSWSSTPRPPGCSASPCRTSYLSLPRGGSSEPPHVHLVDAKVDSLFVAGGAFLSTRRVQLAVLAARYAVPAAYSQRSFVEAGGLMSYGPNFADNFRQVGVYAA